MQCLTSSVSEARRYEFCVLRVLSDALLLLQWRLLLTRPHY